MIDAMNYRLKYALVLTALAVIFTGCSSNNSTSQPASSPTKGAVTDATRASNQSSVASSTPEPPESTPHVTQAPTRATAATPAKANATPSLTRSVAFASPTAASRNTDVEHLRVAHQVNLQVGQNVTVLSLSPNGKYLESTHDDQLCVIRVEPVWKNKPSKPTCSTPKSVQINHQTSSSWSPDSAYIVFIANDYSLWVFDPRTGLARHLLDNGWSLAWSPDGSKIAFARRPTFA